MSSVTTTITSPQRHQQPQQKKACDISSTDDPDKLLNEWLGELENLIGVSFLMKIYIFPIGTPFWSRNQNKKYIIKSYFSKNPFLIKKETLNEWFIVWIENKVSVGVLMLHFVDFYAEERCLRMFLNVNNLREQDFRTEHIFHCSMPLKYSCNYRFTKQILAVWQS